MHFVSPASGERMKLMHFYWCDFDKISKSEFYSGPEFINNQNHCFCAGLNQWTNPMDNLNRKNQWFWLLSYCFEPKIDGISALNDTIIKYVFQNNLQVKRKWKSNWRMFAFILILLISKITIMYSNLERNFRNSSFI